MAQSNQSSFVDKAVNQNVSNNKNSDGIVHLNKLQEEKQTAESSAFEQVMMQMNIADRTSFDKKYDELWREASEENEMLSLMICEIDFFKEYHSNYGHQGASFMLLVIALALKSTCEEYGCYLGRYKGDEFGILLKGGNEKTVSEIAEKLRSAVEKSRTEHKFSDVSNIVTLSVGLSCFYPTSMQVVMNQASKALSDAKASGRNKVVGDLEQEKLNILAQKIELNEKTADVEIALDQKESIQTKNNPDSLKQEQIVERKKVESVKVDNFERKTEEIVETKTSEDKANTKKGFLKKVPFYKRAASSKKLTPEQEKKLKEEKLLNEEKRKKEEELLRKQEEEFLRKQEEEDKRKKDELGAYDMDPFF